jgi:hypothetical protein
LLAGSVGLEEFVLRRHREIFYGLLFGFGAAFIDTFIDAKTQNKSFWDVSIGMTLYRSFFVIFGLVLGWLLWRKNESERGFRLLQDQLQNVQKEFGAPVTLIQAQAQLLLAGPGRQLSPEDQSAVRVIYEQSQRLQAINREKHPKTA